MQKVSARAYNDPLRSYRWIDKSIYYAARYLLKIARGKSCKYVEC